jgi:hypothetical protein
MADNNHHQPPADGRGLYAWARRMEDRHGCGMVLYLRKYGKHRGFPIRILDWSADEVALAYSEASKQLREYLK